jgi:RNA polymerase sigma-70 factor (ECF subfamily)
MYQTDNIAEIFKTEYSNIVAVLCHYYKVGNIQLAEDLVSETFLKAMKTWSHNGIPDSPKAWLRKTAKNLYIDQIRRQNNFESNISPELKFELIENKEVDINDEIIEE